MTGGETSGTASGCSDQLWVCNLGAASFPLLIFTALFSVYKDGFGIKVMKLLFLGD